jgi:hypothetical protein
VEVKVDGVTVAFYAGVRRVGIISGDGKWGAEIRIEYLQSRRFCYALTISITTQDGRVYLSMETSKKEASALLRAMRGVPKNEKEAMRKAKEILDATKGLVGSILGPVLRP